MTAGAHTHDHAHEEKSTPDLVAPTRPHPHAIKKSADGHSPDEVGVMRLERIVSFLEAHFGDVELLEPGIKPAKMEEDGDEDEAADGEEKKDDEEEVQGPAIVIKLDEYQAYIGLLDMVSLPPRNHEPMLN